ncbi:hypothetical protein [Variovorax gossypii]|uniref:hypothetical protein n=1 Tax=uncultured Variovorax sp. TaxID=114708 RepID=UPI0026295435|nr:hypothetical protein [uncultured Variovorax sp.]
MSTPTLDLFDQPSPEPQRDQPSPAQSVPQSLATVTAAGLPTEWGFKAIEAVFDGRKERIKKLEPTARAELIKALWIYAVARHEALLARRGAAAAQQALLGHRNATDELALALKLIDSHCIIPSDIPPAREYAPADLRSIAGESPFPIPPDKPGLY